MSKNRLNIEISPTIELADVLEEIRRATGRNDRAEVVRDALAFYDLVVSRAMLGKRIYIGDFRESSGEVLLPHLMRAQTSRFLEAIDAIIKGGKP